MPSPMLPHLVTVLREARIGASLKFVHIAARVTKDDGQVGVSETTISRFEQATHWPKDPDAFVAAYAQAVGASTCELWTAAAERCRGTSRRR